MEVDFTLGEDFLREVVRAVVRDAANFIIPGSAVGVVLMEYVGLAFCKAAWGWLQRKKVPQWKQTIDALTLVPVDRAKAIAKAELDCYEFSPDTKMNLVNYLSAIPMTARRAISRPNDGGVPTTLLSQLPQNHTDLLRFVPLRPPRFQPGDQVPGHDYRLEFLLGQGGFAEVWKARHILRETQSPVALKFCLDPALLVSLKTEIKVLDLLKDHRHPEDFVSLLETAYSADPPFLVYEYIDGGDLTAWLADFDGKRPSIRDVVRVLKMTARALAFAHKHGIVHRDLKPANLLITRQGRVKVADFGIGAIIADAEAQHERGKYITGATLLRGAYTPLYADPLQPPGKATDSQVDVYALGVIAYQLLTCDVTRQIGPAWRTELQQNDVPIELLDVIQACVDTPSNRLPHAGALLAKLDKLSLDPRSQEVNRDTSVVIVNYCIQCGAKIPSDDRFCTQCGYRVR